MQCDSTLELKMYRGFGARDATLRLPAHADLSTCTILAQDLLGGLEVWDGGNTRWTRAPAQRDTVLVNAGDFLEHWTRNDLPSTQHRWSLNTNAARLTFAPLTH